MIVALKYEQEKCCVVMAATSGRMKVRTSEKWLFQANGGRI
jgi:hypothetical protein